MNIVRRICSYAFHLAKTVLKKSNWIGWVALLGTAAYYGVLIYNGDVEAPTIQSPIT